MTFPFKLGAFLLLLGMLVPLSPAATYTPTLQDVFKIGGIIEKDFIAGNSESEGALIVGGDLLGVRYQVMLRQDASLLNGHALYVGGQINLADNNPDTLRASGSVQYGSLKSGLPTHLTDGNLNNQEWINPKQGSAPAGSGVSQGTLDVAPVFADLRSLSARIEALAGVQGTAVTFGVQNQTEFSLSPTAPLISDTSIIAESFRLFTVKASEFTGKTLNSYNMNGWNSSDLIIIHIVNDLGPNGTADPNATINYTFDIGNSWADNILWNLTSGNLTNQNKSITGSVLAPNSTLTQGSSNIDGSIFVHKYIGTNAGELHPANFGGTFQEDSVVPEPTSALAGLLLAMGLMRRRR